MICTSSKNSWTLLMQVVKPELEILVIAVSIGHPFEHFYLVVQTLQWACRNPVLEIAQQPISVILQGLGNFGEVSVTQRSCLPKPVVQKYLGH